MRKSLSLLLVLVLAASTFAVKELLDNQKSDSRKKPVERIFTPPLSAADHQPVQLTVVTDREREKAEMTDDLNQLPAVKRNSVNPAPPLNPAVQNTIASTPDYPVEHYSGAEAEIVALKEAGRPVNQDLYDRMAKYNGIYSAGSPLLERQGGDTIEEAEPVTLDTTVSGTTIGYTDDYDEQCPYTGSTSPDVVYLLTLEEGTGVILDLCEAGYDSKLYVYNSDMSLIGCSDDDCGVQSELFLEFIPADDYYIIVDGYYGYSGEYVLHITEFRCDPLECDGTEEIEDNGGCNADTPLFQDIEMDETICGTTWVEGGDWDEDWIVFDLPEFYEITLQVDPYNFNPILYLVSDPNENCTGGTVATVNNGVFCESETYTTILGPGHYYAWIKEFDVSTDLVDAEFSLTLTGEVFTPPTGDFCADAIPITELPFSGSGTNTDNTDSYGNAAPDEWYDLQLAESGNVFITLCGTETDFDTYLYLLTDDCATQLAYDDDGSLCEEDSAPYEPSELFEFLMAGDYRICVEGLGSNTGNYNIEVTIDPFEPGVGDFCGDPFLVEELPYSTTGTTTDNIDTYGYDSPDEWYQVEIYQEGLYTFSLCGSTFNTYMYLLADDCSTQLAYNDNDCDQQSRLTLPLDPGVYNLCVEGYFTAVGDFELEISEVICDPLECEGSPEVDDNGGCHTTPYAFQEITPDEVICGELWASTNERDSDWFVFDLDDFYLTTIVVESYNCDPYLYLVSDPTENCVLTTVASVNNGTICEGEELSAITGPGHYYIYIMHDAFELAEGEYSLTMSLETWVPPPGDFCAEPLMIDSFPLEIVGTTADNTDSQFNPSPDEWYEFTIEESGNFYATLCGAETDYDTYLRLLADDCATQIVYDDDGPACEEDQSNYNPSEIMQFLEIGTYKLCVEGYSSNSGNYYLNATYNAFTPGVGDFCDDPNIVELPFDTTATTLDNIDTYGYTSPDEWYSFDVVEEGLITISLCEGTNYDSYIRLLADDCVTVIETDDYGCGVFGDPSYMMRLMQPGTYLLCVEASSGDSGGEYNLSIEWEEFNPPPGEYCESAIQIPFLPFEAVETTADNLDTYGSASPDEWYQFSLPAEGNVLISLCDGGTTFDSYLRLLSDDCVNQIDYNDDACGVQSEMDVFLNPGSYVICVEGFSSYSGDYSLVVTTDAPSQGNDCNDPFIIDQFPFSDEWLTTGYGNSGFNPSPDVFYEFLLAEEGVYTFTTCMEETYEGYFDTRLLILAEDCETLVYSNDDDCDGAYSNWSTITTCLAQGLYYLVIEGYETEAGNYQLECFYEGSCDPCDPPYCPDWGIDEVEPNDGSNSNPPSYDNIAFGETHCGGVWSNNYTRDTDWYQFTVDADVEVDLLLDGEEGHALVMYLIDESSGSPEILATGSPQGYCSDHRLTFTITAAGTYSAFIAYDDYYPASPSSEYTLTWINPEDVPVADGTPQDYELRQNYPNPFNPSTTIEFTLPVAARVELTIYDIAGRQVATLLNDARTAGTHTVQFNADTMPSGLYFYLIQAGEFREVHKMLLVK